MPQNLTVDDYTFYFVHDSEGRYNFKGERGDIFRKLNAEFAEMMNIVSRLEQGAIIKLFGISSVEVIKTGEHTLVYDLFKDLREELADG